MSGKHCPRCGETRPLGEYNVCVPCAAACGWDPECEACKVEDRGGVALIPHVETCDPGARARRALTTGDGADRDLMAIQSWDAAENAAAAEDAAELARLRADNAEYQQLFRLQWDRTAEATGRWRAEDPQARALVMPDLGALLEWLMGQADGARSKVARKILARARALQADMDGDPNLAADPAVAGEIEGLWAAVRIADERTWEQSGWEAKRG